MTIGAWKTMNSSLYLPPVTLTKIQSAAATFFLPTDSKNPLKGVPCAFHLDGKCIKSETCTSSHDHSAEDWAQAKSPIRQLCWDISALTAYKKFAAPDQYRGLALKKSRLWFIPVYSVMCVCWHRVYSYFAEKSCLLGHDPAKRGRWEWNNERWMPVISGFTTPLQCQTISWLEISKNLLICAGLSYFKHAHLFEDIKSADEGFFWHSSDYKPVHIKLEGKTLPNLYFVGSSTRILQKIQSAIHFKNPQYSDLPRCVSLIGAQQYRQISWWSVVAML